MAWTFEVWALLAWPLDALSKDDARARLQPSTKLQAAEDDHTARLAGARRSRERALRALESADDFETARLDADEAQAEVDALLDGAP